MKRSELQVEFKTKEGKVQELGDLVEVLTKDRAELKEELNNTATALAQSQTLLQAKNRELEESSQEVEDMKKQALQLRNTADQAKSEASQLQAAVDQHKTEMELVMKMELTREEEVKVVVGQLEQRLSELSTRLEGEVQNKITWEGLKLKMQEKLDSSLEAFEKIQEQLEAKTDLVEAQKISIDNLYSQLTVSNQSFEAVSKEKNSMEATHEEKIAEMAAEHKERVTKMSEEHKEKVAWMAEEHNEKIAEMVEEHEKLKTDLREEYEMKVAEEKSEHEGMTRTMEEEHKTANSETEAKYKKLLAKEKSEHEQIIVDRENQHQNAKLAIQVLEASAEELKIQVECLTKQLLEGEVRSEELNKKLLVNHEELNQMKAVVVEKNGEVEKSLKEGEEKLAVVKRRHEATLEELNWQFKLKEECAQAQIEEKKASICELQDRMEEAKRKHIGEIEEAEEKEAELKYTLDTYRRQVEELEQSLGDNNLSYAANISVLEEELMEFKLKMVKMETTKNEVTEKLDQMERDLVDVKQNSAASVKALEKKLGDAQSLGGQLRSAISSLEAEGEKNAATIAGFENLLKEKENTIERFQEEQNSAAICMNNQLDKIRKLEGKLSDAVTKTNLYKSKIEATSQECLATIQLMETSKTEASASIRGYQKRWGRSF